MTGLFNLWFIITCLGGLLPLRNGNNSFLNIFGLRALNSDFCNVGV